MFLHKPRIFLAGLLLIIVSVALPELSHAQNLDEPASDGTQTLQTLQQTIIPDSDRIDLARRLRGVTDIPTPPTSPLRVYQIGDQETFWADNADEAKNFQVTAALVYATPHVYMWFEQDAAPDPAAVKRSADEFERHIYPTVHQYFGLEPSPGIDGDVHLYILHAHGLGRSIAGYFGSSSGYLQKVVKTSNQHEMFFINLDTVANTIGTSYYDGLLAHEFQHMVHNAVDPNEESWLNEGLSELSRLLNGYADTGFAPQFLSVPITQLDTWSLSGSNAPHYGAAYLFTAYFLQRFGDEAVKALVADPENGLPSFDDVLKKIGAKDPLTGKPITVIDLYADWQMANLLNDKRVGDGRYVYTRFNERLPKLRLSGALEPGAHDMTTNQWGTRYLELKTTGTYKLTFAGQPTVQIVPTNAHSGRRMWWSNRADKSDTRLTHAFDLSGVSTATLNYWVWHAIEKDWDYGYLEVSTDGGQTWQPLPTANTLSTDPHDNAYGAGYSGNSGVQDFDNDQPAQWVQEKVDLTAYAGKSIQVRFEYITDDAVALPGMLIDDVSIPEISYSTDAEADDGGWQAEGWVRSDNTLPQRYLIQAVMYGKTRQVTRLLDPAQSISGSWELTVGGDVDRIVLSISGTTEFTTEPAPYSYTLTPER